jgi:hypothetical protein
MNRVISLCIMAFVATLIFTCAYFIVTGFYLSDFSNSKLLERSGAPTSLSTTAEKSGVWLLTVDYTLESTIYTQSVHFVDRFNELLLAQK